MPGVRDGEPGYREFCLACGERTRTEAPPEEERKPDTRSSSTSSARPRRAEQLDPEDVLALLEPYYGRLRNELERYGGTVEKYIGDAVVAVFGAPVAHEDDPERAVRAALAILEAIDELNEEDPWPDLHVRIGVTTGEAIVASSAEPERGKGMAAGDVINTAARIESAAPVNGVLVGEVTYRRRRTRSSTGRAEPIAGEGQGRAGARLGGGRGAGGRRPAAAARRAARRPRGRARAPARALAGGVRRDGARRSRSLLGAPGHRQEPPADRVRRRTSRPTATGRYWGRCLSYGEGITYWPVDEILEEAAGILPERRPRAVSAKLGALLESSGTDDPDELRTMAAALANLLGVRDDAARHVSAAEISQAELHWGIRRLLELLAARAAAGARLRGPALGGADAVRADRVPRRGRRRRPIFVLASARPELPSCGRTSAPSRSIGVAIPLERSRRGRDEALLASCSAARLPPSALDAASPRTRAEIRCSSRRRCACSTRQACSRRRRAST